MNVKVSNLTSGVNEKKSYFNMIVMIVNAN